MKYLLLSVSIFITVTVSAQNNVGVGTTTPDPSAILDVDATNKGLLVPRIALVQTTNVAPVTAPATSLLVYNTATVNDVVPGYYYWDGTVWSPLTGAPAVGGNDWALLGNTGTNAATNFLGTTDAQNLIIKTNNTERAIYQGTGGIRYNLTGADLGAPGFNVMQVNAGGDDDGFVGNSVTGQGIESWSTGATSTPMIGAGQGSGAFLLTNGSGGSFNGVSTGLYARTTGFANTQGIIAQDAFAAQWAVGDWNGFGYSKIIGNGAVSTIVKNTEEKNVTMFCVEAPENFFQDIGHAKLVNGKASVKIDPNLTKNIIVNEEHPLKVFIQLEGDCKGVYVTNKTAIGFDVVELENGNTNVDFTYTIYATRGDEKYIGENGEIRIAKYDRRFPLAPTHKKTIKEEQNTK